MLLRTLLLFLCVSSGLCATLGLFQMQKEEETPPQDAAAVLDSVVETSDGHIQDTEATTDPSPHVEEGLPETLMPHDIQLEVDKEAKEDTPVADAAPAEEAVTGSDNKTEDVPIVEAQVPEDPTNDQPSPDVPVVEAQVPEDPTNDQPSPDVPIVEAKVPEDPTNDQLSPDVPIVEAKVPEDPTNDQPSLDVPIVEAKVPEDPTNNPTSTDVPIVEAKVVKAPIQDQPLQEEDNEIKPIQTEEVPQKPEESHSGWGFNSIRSSFQNMNGYFDSLVELVGGRNGVCEYRCRYGEIPAPRPGYQLPEPNGCSSSLVGFQLDLGIPAMTQCCNQLDICYDTCGNSKYDCDSSFRSCLHDICSDLKKSLGLGTKVQTCESVADGLFNTVWTLGCRPYMNSQRAACICHEEERDEL